MAGHQDGDDAETWNKMLFGNGYCTHLLRRDMSHQLQRDEDDDDVGTFLSKARGGGGRTPILSDIFNIFSNFFYQQ